MTPNSTVIRCTEGGIHARQARKKSKSDIYHVLLRGTNRQVIFEDEEDSNVFLITLGTYKAEFNCQIYAYCLMKNHVHLLIKIGQEDLQHETSKCGSASEFQALPVGTRNRCLAVLKKKGLSVRQIERLTGINRGLVQKA